MSRAAVICLIAVTLCALLLPADGPASDVRETYSRFVEEFSGRVSDGQRFRRSFGTRFEFILEPVPMGWEIVVREQGGSENLARLTPPLHFAPNPREIEGWHLSKNPLACASRPYAADAGPPNPRRFIFSPEVGGRIDGPGAGRSVTVEEVEEVTRFGHGDLTIENYQLQEIQDGCLKFEWMSFSVHLDGG